MTNKIKIIFFGTPDIGLKSLEHLFYSDRIEVSAVVTQPDKPSGRGNKIHFSPIKEFAIRNNLPYFQPKSIKKDFDIQKKLKNFEPDFFVTFAYGQILSKEVLDIPKKGTINLHASLLPKYRGANPIQCAIVNGEIKTGITTMLTIEELDAGDICLSQEIEITQDMRDVDLCEKVSSLAPDLLYKTLLLLYENKLQPKKQPSGASFTCKFEKNVGLIDWSKDALSIHNKIRGLYSWPGCYTFFKGKMIKITKSCLSEQSTDKPFGTFLGKADSGINISTGNNQVLTIVNIKPEGKKEMSAKDWLNGSQMKIGDTFLNK